MTKAPNVKENLPFNVGDLIGRGSLEGNRVEFKSTWSNTIKSAVVRTVCAFANDLLNLNGGYVILGIEEHAGHPDLPPAGLANFNLDTMQREIRGACKNIRPDYQPVLFPTQFEDKWILIIWAPAGDNRPYQCPEDSVKKGSGYSYYIRQGSETVKALGDLQRQLFESAAKVPFDDRRNNDAKIEDISPSLVRRFLNDIRSDLLISQPTTTDLELYRRLRIVTPIHNGELPKNIGLLFFSEDPDRFFPGARVEIVQFGDAAGDLIDERVIRGPLPEQINTALKYLQSFGGRLLEKVRGQAEVERTVAYPYEAMEEAIVNAVYHRSYEGPPEPVKIYLYPDRMEITSYPGPVPGIRPENFWPGNTIPAVPARNRRIGEFLKELRLAEARGTGIPKIRMEMRHNGSPDAVFNFDSDRTFFQVVLPVHPRYVIVHALRAANHYWAIGEKNSAVGELAKAFQSQPMSGAIAAQLIEYAFETDSLELAQKVFDQFDSQPHKNDAPRPYLTMARLLVDRSQMKEAQELLRKMPAVSDASESLEAAILQKKTGDFQGAHHALTKVFESNPNDSRIVHELAQVKIKLAAGLSNKDHFDSKRRLNKEAETLLRRAIELTNDPTRQAWCWYHLGRCPELR